MRARPLGCTASFTVPRWQAALERAVHFATAEITLLSMGANVVNLSGAVRTYTQYVPDHSITLGGHNWIKHSFLWPESSST